MPFSKLGLSDKVLAAVTAAGYPTPTPIQEQAIPHVLARRDVLGIAQTGTGKTAAFTLPMLTMLEQGRARARMPRTLILEPTRELAAQVEESFDKYGKNHKLNVALIIGGVSFDDQDSKLMRGVDVLIATPGRLLDHSERGRLLMSGVELLVIDEADRMLDMGFIPDIERICKLVPFTRQTLFFTATMPPEIRRITEQFLHNPVQVEVSKPATTVATITQQLVKTGREPHDKRDTLRRTDPRRRQLQERHHLLQPQARGRAAAPLAGAPRLQRRSAARRPGPVGAHRRARCVPQRRGQAADRLRRRRPRPRHSRRQPRLQFRRAASRRRLRPPHRPHRPRRQDRHRHHHRRPGRRQGGRRDREADRPEHSVGRAGRSAPPPRQPTRPSTRKPASHAATIVAAAATSTRPSRRDARPSRTREATIAPARGRRNPRAARQPAPRVARIEEARHRQAPPGRASRSITAAANICRPFCSVRCAARPETAGLAPYNLPALYLSVNIVRGGFYSPPQ